MHPINHTSCLSFSSMHTASFRCLATNDLPGGPTSLRWPDYPSAEDISIRLGPDSEGSSIAGVSGVDNGNIKVNARENKWSRHRESYLTDDSEPLPLPMTYPGSSPLSPEEIDKWLRCDPQVQDCKEVVYEWTGKCRSCQGTGYVSYYTKRGKEII